MNTDKHRWNRTPLPLKGRGVIELILFLSTLRNPSLRETYGDKGFIIISSPLREED